MDIILIAPIVIALGITKDSCDNYRPISIWMGPKGGSIVDNTNAIIGRISIPEWKELTVNDEDLRNIPFFLANSAIQMANLNKYNKTTYSWLIKRLYGECSTPNPISWSYRHEDLYSPQRMLHIMKFKMTIYHNCVTDGMRTIPMTGSYSPSSTPLEGKKHLNLKWGRISDFPEIREWLQIRTKRSLVCPVVTLSIFGIGGGISKCDTSDLTNKLDKEIQETRKEIETETQKAMETLSNRTAGIQASIKTEKNKLKTLSEEILRTKEEGSEFVASFKEFTKDVREKFRSSLRQESTNEKRLIMDIATLKSSISMLEVQGLLAEWDIYGRVHTKENCKMELHENPSIAMSTGKLHTEGYKGSIHVKDLQNKLAKFINHQMVVNARTSMLINNTVFVEEGELKLQNDTGITLIKLQKKSVDDLLDIDETISKILKSHKSRSHVSWTGIIIGIVIGFLVFFYCTAEQRITPFINLSFMITVAIYIIVASVHDILAGSVFAFLI